MVDVRNRLSALTLPDLSGQTWLVTGATNGIGREAARAASRAGARILLTARDATRGTALADELGNARVIDVDFADLARVRAGAGQVDEDVDVLIDNAGRAARQREETKDGFEAVMGTNVHGPFAFTNLVADRVKHRIVITGSNAHLAGKLDLDDLHLRRRRWTMAQAYAQSKLADMLWGLELERRMRPRGVGVYLVHPGWVLTNIQNQTGSARLDAAITRVSAMIAQSPVDGAKGLLMAATTDLPSGSYLGPTGMKQLRGEPVLLGRSAAASDPELARRLWEKLAAETGTDLPA